MNIRFEVSEMMWKTGGCEQKTVVFVPAFRTIA